MTNEELLQLIDSDPEAKGYADIGNDAACALRVSAIAPKVRRPVPALDLQYVAMRRGIWGDMKVKANDSQVAGSIRALCHMFIDQVMTGRSIDFELPEVSGMLQQLVAVGVVPSAVSSEIIELSYCSQTIAAKEVSEAYMSRRPGGHL